MLRNAMANRTAPRIPNDPVGSSTPTKDKGAGTTRRRTRGATAADKHQQQEKDRLVGPGPVISRAHPALLGPSSKRSSTRTWTAVFLRLLAGLSFLLLSIYIGFYIFFQMPGGFLDESMERWNSDWERLNSQEYRDQLEVSRNHTRHVEEHRILLYTTVFGKAAMNKRLFRLFLESSRRSGVDILILGHPAPTIPLPPNVKYFDMTWDQFADRLRDRVLGGKEPFWMRNGKFPIGNKICDYRPLFAKMFPELVEGYDFWGQTDNDVLLGDVRHMVGKSILAEYDIITPIDNQYTLGLMMLYRNTPIVNELFLLTKRPNGIFNSFIPRAFDEWGGMRRGFYLPYEDTMSGVVDLYHKQLGLKWYGGIQHFFDGACSGDPYAKHVSCCDCNLLPRPNGHQTIDLDCEDGQHYEAIACHFMYYKSDLEKSLADDSHYDDLLNQMPPSYRVNVLEKRIDIYGGEKK